MSKSNCLKEQQISILSAIPNDSLNIIKEFLVETRKPSFLKVVLKGAKIILRVSELK